ncbi:NB-ARC domain-containing protein [Thermomonospora umbrina]|uniref:NB-ARC domain-containing protein n=1 Tax=Thermomonospora umbrina TaxID=111806 RepID=A0A3D9SJ46_9ACTN|nr:NB-ARC domain-containing protein [Thermomonospora umbrina]
MGWAVDRALTGAGQGAARMVGPREHARVLRRALAEVRDGLPEGGERLTDAVSKEIAGRRSPAWYEGLSSLEEVLAAELAELPERTYGRGRSRATGRELLERCEVTLDELTLRLAGALETAVRAEAAEQGGLPERLRQLDHERLTATVEASGPTVEMLPAGILVMVNRDDEFAVLDAVSSRERAPGSPGMAVLTAMTGMGKTAVGVHWARKRRERFPDGLLYFDFGGLSEREVSGPGDVLGVFLRALGADREALPDGHAERVALFHHLTAGRRLLVFLDNVTLVRQVEDLLPGSSGSMVVISTDRRLSGLVQYGSVTVPLKPLSPDHSVRLLTELAGEADPARLAELADLCGHWPLALRIAGGWMAAHPTRSPERAIARLARDPLRGLPGEELTVESVANAAYEDLPEDARRAYRSLSLHPGARPRFSSAAASALLGEDAEDVLDVLVDRHLLEYSAGRYTFHDLVRLHARERAGDDERAVRRLVEFYLAEAARADATVNPARAADTFGPAYRGVAPGPSVRDALAWLDAEQRNLSAMVHEAAARGWHDLAWQLCEALWSLYFSFKYHDDWIITHRIGFASAQGNPQAVFRVGIQLGRALYETGEFTQAHEILDQALTAARALGDPRHEATAVEFIGRAHEGSGALDAAFEHFTLALALERAARRERGVAIDLHHLGRVRLARARRHRAGGRPDEAAAELAEALRSLREAGEMFAAISDDYNRAHALHSLGHALIELGEDPIDVLTEALAVMRAQGRAHQEFRILTSLAAFTRDPAYAAEAEAVQLRLGLG